MSSMETFVVDVDRQVPAEQLLREAMAAIGQTEAPRAIEPHLAHIDAARYVQEITRGRVSKLVMGAVFPEGGCMKTTDLLDLRNGFQRRGLGPVAAGDLLRLVAQHANTLAFEQFLPLASLRNRWMDFDNPAGRYEIPSAPVDAVQRPSLLSLGRDAGNRLRIFLSDSMSSGWFEDDANAFRGGAWTPYDAALGAREIR